MSFLALTLGLETVRTFIQRLHKIDPKTYMGKGKLKAQLTVSVGLLWLKPSVDLPLNELLDAADKLMYQAKRAGGDRVVDRSIASRAVSIVPRP